MRFEIQKSVLEKAPDIFIGIVVGEGIDNTRGDERLAGLLAEKTAALLPTLSGKVKEDARVLPYREAFQKLGINPNKYMCSIEALMTRIQKSGRIPSINPVVDAGNAVSIGHFLPIGAHDLGQAGDRIELRYSRPGDRFIPFGQAECEAVDEGEVVYASDDVVRTRRWMWRQSETGKITSGASRIFFPIDGFAGVNADEVLKARDELAGIVEAELCGKAVKGFVDRDHPVFAC
jgi:DNA/RNA-binding domain of Phe-tRNA-synthetase-like protein